MVLKDSRKDSGFSLIEMLIVVALIALISVLVLPNVGRVFQASVDSSLRRMASIIKESYQSAVVTGRVHRLVYDLSKQTFWVESGPPTFLLDTEKSRRLEEERTTLFERNEKEAAGNGFQLARTVTREKIALPNGIVFEDVQSERSPDPVVEGVAYTHFFPHGLTERTLIHLKDTGNGRQYTVMISALIGKSRIFNEYVKEGELFGN